MLQNTSRVKIKYRTECYAELGRTSVKPCPMMQRKTLLDKLSLSDNYSISSDIFVFDPDALTCSKEVIIEMPVLEASIPDYGQLIVKIQNNGSWSDIKVFEKVSKLIDSKYHTMKVSAAFLCRSFCFMNFKINHATNYYFIIQ